ncbi:phosphoglycerate dehydrogenase [Ignatzschineria sp. RMDPL8A]|uniref:phosphoglycerate dehydrogenase n=1 Tax=Ignatzschineria sp. RMDPL8A TaxID=2999236 RepID=UPI00244675B9|nr:phosphoglycerate dehydrogenase [Ignatzschineria sp. RMDPL8A]MDG9729933.1 phosphoglycerate dehydrogenase [Ignatzschineria sp. RMDPL8A]
MKKTSFPKSEIKVVLLEGVHQEAVKYFEKEGYSNIEYHPKALEGAELLEAIKDAHILGIRSRTQLTEEVLAHAEKLMAVGCFCIGTNQVNLVEAERRAIPVFNAPYSNTRSVAELVIAEMIMLKRGIPYKNYMCHEGGWMKSAKDSFEVRGKTLGIIGYGHIGTQVGILAESFGMHVIYYDIESKLALGNAQPASSLNRLLEESDIVTLHVPEDATTKNLMSRERLAFMKQSSVLINASRGTVVDLDALAEFIEKGHISGAAIDVFPVEPKSNNDEFISPLRKLQNVILTPHIGGSTVEAQKNIGIEVASKLVLYSDNGSTLSAVNFPEVSLPKQPGSNRILHVHKNRPGILHEVNQHVSKLDLNINAQYLQTSAEMGYVVLDVSGCEDAALKLYEAMKEIDGTLKCRILY